MIAPLFILSLAGLIVSLYGIFVERSLKNNPLYKPACDLSEYVSCSKLVESDY